MKVLVLGGAGFIGCNTADYFVRKGHDVTILDNFSRQGTEKNWKWLKEEHPSIRAIRADIVYNQHAIDDAVEHADLVIHLAGQVAVTTSVENPRMDFMSNALGTFNVLEAVRRSRNRPMMIFSSTNKVYGSMDDIRVVERNGRYEYEDHPFGLSEDVPLDFHSPYGCSKGAADQYVHDYHNIYGLDTVVFRQSCIYGKRQFGVEDQGWLAWFTIAAVLDKQITVYGDGKQIRDVLFVDDLCRLYEVAYQNRGKASGRIYNVGGGPDNTLSLNELLNMLEEKLGKKIPVKHDKWRPGDQKVFVADIRKVENELGWKPETSVEDGVYKLARWVMENMEIFEEF